MEWIDPYNSFNSFKGLLYREQFDGIIKRSLTPPIEVNIDPVNNCQLKCLWCNGKNIISKDKTMMTNEHLMELVHFCSQWGVKAICYAGGGEPTLHPMLGDAMLETVASGMETAIITNGLFTSEEQIEKIAKSSRWIGISVDAALDVTYAKCKLSDKFYNVISNIRRLADYSPKEITFKFLVHPINQYEIYDACKLAKDIGCTVFHVRMLAERYVTEGKFDYPSIWSQLEKCQNENSKDFKVFTIRHKQEGDGNRRIRFDACRASPLLCMVEANGDVSVCIDRKGDPKTRLCSHNDVNELKAMWGSNKHFELLDAIRPETDCNKCTMCIYQELVNAYERDAFCVNFP